MHSNLNIGKRVARKSAGSCKPPALRSNSILQLLPNSPVIFLLLSFSMWHVFLLFFLFFFNVTVFLLFFLFQCDIWMMCLEVLITKQKWSYMSCSVIILLKAEWNSEFDAPLTCDLNAIRFYHPTDDYVVLPLNRTLNIGETTKWVFCTYFGISYILKNTLSIVLCSTLLRVLQENLSELLHYE